MLPLVSIITPAYNRASYLEETIESVLIQDYPHIEYIVLDDGSTDNTREVLAKYSGRLVWETHTNVGETRTVNKGLEMSRGEIVAVVNSDDPLLPGAVREAVAYMEAHPDILVAYPDWNKIGPDSELIDHVQVREYDYLSMLKFHRPIPGPGAFIRRRAFELTGMRDPEYKYVADLEYWLRLGLYGKFARIPQTLATFRVHQDSASVSHKGIAMADEHIRLIKKFYSSPGLPLEVRKVRGEAFAWAHYEAAYACGSARIAASGHYLKAMLYHPPTFLRNLINLRKWKMPLSIILPAPLFKVLFGGWQGVQTVFGKGRRLLRRKVNING